MKRKKRHRWTLEDIEEFARNKGGKFLSKTFSTVLDICEWECSDGHKWETRASNIIYSKTWCPKCSSNLTEEKCRYIFEWFTQKQWTRNRGIIGNLELDGFCKELNAAFEYNGEQHYQEEHIFRKTSKLFKKQKERDLLKQELCDLR